MNVVTTSARRRGFALGGDQAAPAVRSQETLATAGAHGGNVFRAAREWGCDWNQILDFSASINPLGVSDAVHQALASSIGRVAHYPEAGSPALHEAVSLAWGLEPGQVMAGNGATELLYFLVRVLRPRKAHLVLPTFSEYPKALSGSEISFTLCDAGVYAINWERLAADVNRARPDWLVLTHPNNPTGSAFDPERFLQWFDEERPSETIVVLDESFVDFAPRLSITNAAEQRRNLLVLRSLTKFYALPGLRLGCLAAHPETIAAFESVREPWQVNVLAEQAALAALSDDGYRRETLELVNTEREWLLRALGELPGVRPLPSAANFLFAHCEGPVSEMQSHLRHDRILIRDCTGMAGIRGHAFRVAVRTHAENEALVTALAQFFER
ncbi:MAG: threonine-phosphate decarboxylase CobD [Bryobacterales bacterium]